jgi:hypothetical protein
MTAHCSTSQVMKTAPTKDGKWVTLGVGTPVFRQGALIGFNEYVLTDETYPHPSGGVGHYARRTFIPKT